LKRATLTKEEFKILFDNHFDGVRRYLLYRSGNADLATDLAQEVFMKLWEKRNRIFYDTSKGLLFKMAADLAVSRHRKEKASQGFLKNFRLREENYSPHEEMEFEQLKQLYELALRKLGDKQRIVFLMSRVDGMKYSEIAETLGLSVKTVEKRMTLALAFLKKSLYRDER
jgi:RNA polymerase sigma factor (sigma-70 family)